MKNIFKIFRRQWVRIGDLGVVCPICGKPDWCRVSRNGEYVLCSRIPVFSQKGSLHKVDKNIETKGLSDKAIYYPPINWYALVKSYKANCPLWRIKQFSVLKGISAQSLIRLNMGFDGEAYVFPIYNEDFNIVGIQRQFPNSNKSMIRGSKLGIFIPTNYQEEGTLVITEGMSDAAAAMDLGLNAVGRLNNSCGKQILMNICRGFNVVLIVADNDPHRAGEDGAFKLGRLLKGICKEVKIIISPKEYKDLRNWKRKTDLTIEKFNGIVEKLPIL